MSVFLSKICKQGCAANVTLPSWLSPQTVLSLFVSLHLLSPFPPTYSIICFGLQPGLTLVVFVSLNLYFILMV